MTFSQKMRPCAATLMLAVFAGAHLLLPTAAEETFGAGWQPTPLVDTSKPATPAAAQASPAAPAQAAQPDLEKQLQEALKPALPFIADVEARLLLTPGEKTPLTQRLANLQQVLFGEQKYNDAGELMAKMAELFPEEAAKAEKRIVEELKASMSKVSEAAPPPEKGKKPAKPMVMMTRPTTAEMQQQPTQKKSGFFKGNDGWDDFDATFENDPFFNDDLKNRNQSQYYGDTQNQRSSGGSTLRGLGQGILGLAGLAGSVAGSYYLNKKLGGNTVNNNGYYPDYYGSGYGYGVPYGYPVAPNGYYPQGYVYRQPVPGTYGTMYGPPVLYPTVPSTTTIRTRPYGTSALGVPMGSGYRY